MAGRADGKVEARAAAALASIGLCKEARKALKDAAFLGAPRADLEAALSYVKKCKSRKRK